ncbi:hypothetical protein [Litoribrevibacter albus]|uniref:Uncharacterized protein n=1 Tax=Litoribrevibacter albus TaxID=1473156 RepID=A0AA37SAR4_9GAMM|nr:hypothetical protein [Litoribrevibacter albus]GLQ31741.1 hypothetical protein GCM10007876_22200 [Litoribrevibacter albus]
MKIRNLLLLLPAFTLAAYSGQSLATPNSAMESIQSYCNQMAQSGLPEEETKMMIEECINEQSLYLSEAPAEQETDCYQEVDERVAELTEQGSEEVDYDALYEQCMERRK